MDNSWVVRSLLLLFCPTPLLLPLVSQQNTLYTTLATLPLLLLLLVQVRVETNFDRFLLQWQRSGHSLRRLQLVARRQLVNLCSVTPNPHHPPFSTVEKASSIPVRS